MGIINNNGRGSSTTPGKAQGIIDKSGSINGNIGVRNCPQRRRITKKGDSDIVCTVNLDYNVGNVQDTPATTTVSVDGLIFTAIVDTGACASIISIAQVHRLRMMESIQKATRRLIDANGKQIPLLGTIVLPVLFGETIREWIFWVADNVNVPMILGNNILKRANIMGVKKTIEIEADTQLLSYERPIGVAYMILAAQSVYVPPAASCWLKGVVKIKDKEEYNTTTYVECMGVNILDGCDTTDIITKLKYENDTHRDSMVNGFVNMDLINENQYGVHIKKGSTIGKLVNRRDSLLIEEGKTYCNNKGDIICTIFPHLALDDKNLARYRTKELRIKQDTPYKSEMSHTHTLEDESGVGSAVFTPFTASVVDDDCLQMGKVKGGLESLCCVGSGHLSGKMIRHYPITNASGTTLLEALGSRSDSDTISTTTSVGTPTGDCIDKGSGVPGCVVQSNIPVELDGSLVDPHIQPTENRTPKINTIHGNGPDSNPLMDKEGEIIILEKLANEAQGTPENIKQLKALLEQYLDVFSNNLIMAGQAKLFPHIIRLTSEVPLWTAQHRRSHVENEIIDKETQILAKQEVVRQSRSPYNSPVMVVKKKDGAWRTVIDYRNINDITYKEPHPIPRTDEAIEALAEANLFTTLDFTSGYWQIPIREEDKQKTAYSTISGRWEYNVLPMGITNAPSAFQRSMEVMLTGLTWKCCIVYIDDIVIYSKTFDEHLKHLQLVFARLRTYNVHAKPLKCKFAMQEVEYLGHRVGGGIIKPTEHNIKKVSEARLPTTVKEIKQFNGIASYYRKFIPGFAKVMKPLTDMMSDKVQKQKGVTKRGRFTLGVEGVEAYDTIKRLLTSSPVLMLPNFKKEFYVRTDASKYALGGVLFQLGDDNQEHPTQYTSRVMTDTEQRYSATEREMLAIYYCVRHWRPYLYGVRFNVYSDHKPLMGIKVNKDITGRLTRMILKLQEFDFEIHYTPGKDNGVADALSRDPIAGFKGDSLHNKVYSIMILVAADEGNNKVEVVKPPLVRLSTKKRKRFNRGYPDGGGVPLSTEKNSDEIRNAQIEDETLQSIREASERHNQKQWVIINECLHRAKKDKNNNCTRMQLVVPKCYRVQLMEENHDSLWAGHLGYWKTLHRIAKWYFWPKMGEDIKNWVAECNTCQKYKGSTKEKLGYLKPIMATRPFEIVGMDILTDLPVTERGNKHILVFTDYFTKWPEAFSMPNLDAITTARCYVNYIILRHGTPSRIITDRGSQFISDIFREANELLGIKHSMTTAHHPQTDGQAERMVGTISQMLGKMTGIYQEDWDLYIPYALYAYRTALHATTGETPFFMVYGRDEVSPGDAKLRQWIEGKRSVTKYSREVVMRLQQARERVIKNSIKQKKRNEHYYNMDRKLSAFKINDVVWLKISKMKKGEARKLKPKWKGPYRIINCVDDTNNMVVDIQHTGNPKDLQRINVNRLKLAFVREGERIADAEPPPGEADIKEGDVTPGVVKDALVETEVITDKTPVTQIIEVEKKIENPKGRSIWTRKDNRARDNIVQTGKSYVPKETQQEEYEVESIIGERKGTNGGTEYKIKWVGYEPRYSTWEKESNLNCDELLAKWRASKRNKNTKLG